eukprot:TRINITY_DN32289_c0_g1_i1.p1 TRINITY_DN32289_c0_g1~~TRINITY_DN32289_c0_g1_i1.p1  ORF type:complete len:565 (+),score=180.16 TRINITY_DN32289_c0_g1_i1:70-1764(+)
MSGGDEAGGADVAGSLKEWAKAEAVRVGQLERWLDGMLDTAKVRISFVDGRRGLVASQDVEAGGTVLAIPRALFVTLDSMWESGIGFIYEHYSSVIGDAAMLNLYLMWERAQPDSRLLPWLTALPTDFTTVDAWPESVLPLLGHPVRVQKAVRHRRKVAAQYETLRARLLERHPAIFGGPGFSFDAYLWALNVVNTRCFSVSMPGSQLRRSKLPAGCAYPADRERLEAAKAAATEREAERSPRPARRRGMSRASADEEEAEDDDAADCPFDLEEWALMPLGDMFNHSPDGSHEFEYDPRAQAMVFRTTKPVREGDEVLIRYNQSGGWRQAKMYGMVDADGANAEFPVPIPPVPESWREDGASDLDMMRCRVIDERRSARRCYVSLRGPSPRLLQMLRLRYMSQGDLLPGGRLPPTDKMVSPENEWNLWLFLSRYCAAALRTFTVPASADRDWASRMESGEAAQGGECGSVATAVRAADRTVLRFMRSHAKRRTALLASSMLRQATGEEDADQAGDADAAAALGSAQLARYSVQLDRRREVHVDAEATAAGRVRARRRSTAKSAG